MDDFISYLRIQLELIQTWNKCPIHRSHDIEYVHRNMVFCDECRWTKTDLFQNSYEDEKRLGKLVKNLDNVRKGLIQSVLIQSLIQSESRLFHGISNEFTRTDFGLNSKRKQVRRRDEVWKKGRQLYKDKLNRISIIIERFSARPCPMTESDSKDLSNLQRIKLQFAEVLDLFYQIWKMIDLIKTKLLRKTSDPLQKQKLESQQLIFKVFLQYHFDVIGHRLIYYNVKYEPNSLEITFDGKYVPLVGENEDEDHALESEDQEVAVFPICFPSEVVNDSIDSVADESDFAKVKNIGSVEHILMIHMI